MYLVLATWHATLHRRPVWWAAHIALYGAAKAFYPAQAGLVILAIFAYYYFFERVSLIANRRLLIIGVLLAVTFFLLISVRSIWVDVARAHLRVGIHTVIATA